MEIDSNTENAIDAILDGSNVVKIQHKDSSQKIATNVLNVNLDAQYSPAILSGLIGCNINMLYQYRQDGKLPPNSNATYREAILHHTKYWKAKAVKKTSNLGEEAILQKIKLDKAKTEREWLAVAKEKKESIDGKALLMVFEPYFVAMRGQLVAVTRTYPETQQMIDGILNGWRDIGEEMVKNASGVVSSFIEEKLNEQIVIGEETEAEEESVEDSIEGLVDSDG